MNCETAKSRIFPYVDGELDEGTRAELEAHLVACGTCRRLVELEHAFRETCAPALGPDPAPPDVRARITRHLDELARRSHPPRRRRRFPPLLAGAAVLLLLAGAAIGIAARSYLGAPDGLAELADAAVEQHRKLARDLLPVDIGDVTPKAAEAWFRDRLAFSVSVPELPDDQLIFRGGRVSHLRDVEVAALAYRLDGSDVSLFVLPGEAYRALRPGAGPRFRLIRRRGYDVVIWQSAVQGVGYALVSDIGRRACLVCHSADDRLEVTGHDGHL